MDLWLLVLGFCLDHCLEYGHMGLYDMAEE